jgi:UDP-glucose 4-epimerase
MPSRRVLITGLSTFWGGRLAQALEADETIEAIIGIDRTPPKVELERTEFVQVADHHTLIRRIVQGAEIDTVVDTRLVTDSITTSSRKTHENNIIGTMNILAACTGPDTTVRKVVFRSSALSYGSEQDDPAFFIEDMRTKRSPGTPLQRDIVEAEAAVGDFAAKHPETAVTVLRFAHGLGPDMRTSLGMLLSLPLIPMILGFDPRLQFVHEDDIAGALTHAVSADIPGVFNVAADGVLALSEVAGLLNKPVAPLLPPWGTSLALPIAKRLGVRIPPELLAELRYGRGLDNRRFKATGYRLRHTSRETVELLREHQRVSAYTRDQLGPYRYEREVEDFLRWSPSVRREPDADWRPSQEQIAELRRTLDALEREGESTRAGNR